MSFSPNLSDAGRDPSLFLITAWLMALRQNVYPRVVAPALRRRNTSSSDIDWRYMPMGVLGDLYIRYRDQKLKYRNQVFGVQWNGAEIIYTDETRTSASKYELPLPLQEATALNARVPMYEMIQIISETLPAVGHEIHEQYPEMPGGRHLALTLQTYVSDVADRGAAHSDLATILDKTYSQVFGYDLPPYGMNTEYPEPEDVLETAAFMIDPDLKDWPKPAFSGDNVPPHPLEEPTPGDGAPDAYDMPPRDEKAAT